MSQKPSFIKHKGKGEKINESTLNLTNIYPKLPDLHIHTFLIWVYHIWEKCHSDFISASKNTGREIKLKTLNES